MSDKREAVEKPTEIELIEQGWIPPWGRHSYYFIGWNDEQSHTISYIEMCLLGGEKVRFVPEPKPDEGKLIETTTIPTISIKPEAESVDIARVETVFTTGDYLRRRDDEEIKMVVNPQTNGREGVE